MTEIENQIRNFQKKWPLKRIEQLKLEEYTNNNKDSFTYDLEFGTKEVINISGGSSYRNGIYHRTSTSSYNGDGNRLTDNVYAWFSKYGSSAPEAFESVRSLIIQLIKISLTGDGIELVDEIDLGTATKWKIIYMYNPELILPIVSHEKLSRIARFKFNLDVEGKSFWQIQQDLIALKPLDMDGYEFAKGLWEFDSELDLPQILEKFFSQLDSGDLTFSHYPKEYSGLKLKVSFGKGNIAKVPWIAFLKEGKSVNSGINPVLLYYRTQETLIVAYGKGEERASDEDWDIEAPTIKDWFEENKLNAPDRYGDSMVYQAYRRDELDFHQVKSDVDALIDLYHELENSKIPVEKSMKDSTPSYWLLKAGTNGAYWEMFQTKNMVFIGYGNWPDLSQFQTKKEIEDQIPTLEPNWSGSSKNHLTSIWGFSHQIKIGDIIIVAKGTRTYLGYGIVTRPYYYYHKNYGARHRINVDWKQTGEWKLEKGESGFNIKTLLLMDQYEPWPQDVIKMMDGIPVESSSNSYSKVDFLSEVFIDELKLNQILSILERKKNIILQGPPGVGKTFIAKRLAFCALGQKDNTKVGMVQFHQSYSYEDFIQGYRPNNSSGFSLKDGVFFRFCQQAQKDPSNKYFFVIDEINRGNLSKIFGELMLLIEGDKRGEDYAVTLTYQDNDLEPFSVPSNVYLIGTMNTADRSLAVVDYALRRRFSFLNIDPNFNDQFKNFLSKNFDNTIVNKISDRLKTLNEEIKADLHLGDGFLIGHSYFCTNEKVNNPETWYKDIVQFEIEPLLSEYWFDEPEKVRSAIERLLQ